MENSEDLPTTFKSVKSRSLLHYGMMWHVEVAASITSQEDVTSWWQMTWISMHTLGQALILVLDTVSRWISNMMPLKVSCIKILRALRFKMYWWRKTNVKWFLRCSLSIIILNEQISKDEFVVHLLYVHISFSLRCVSSGCQTLMYGTWNFIFHGISFCCQ